MSDAGQYQPVLRRFVQALAVILLLRHVVSAQAVDTTNVVTQYSSRTWQMDDGLPQNAIQALAQTPEGYLWAGTPKGLARFDGARFTVFDSKNTPEIKNSSVTALLEATDGSLWIGTAGGGLAQLKDGQFTGFSLGKGDPENTIKCIMESHDGSLWIGTLGGLAHWVNGTAKFLTEKDGLMDNVVRSVSEKADELWIATGSGLNVLKHGTLASRGELGELSLRTVLRDHKGDLWVGWVGGLMCVRNGQIFYYTKEDGLADNNVCSLFEDRRGELWIGTYGGLSRYVDGKFTIEKDSQGSFYDQINTIMQDQEGDIWVGGRDGLQQFRIKHFTGYSRQQGLGHNNVMSVLEDRQGDMWVGTWGGGLSRMAGDSVTNYNSQSGGLMTELVLGIYEDTDGSILTGSDYEGGTFRYNGNKFSRIWSMDQAAIDRVIRVIYRDREGNLWFGATPGLVQWNTKQHWLTNNTIRCMLEDDQGILWIGTNKGLFCRKDGRIIDWSAQQGRLDGTIIALYEDQDKNLWIGGASSGLVRLHDGRLTVYNSSQGLFSDEIYEILEDAHGWLWMSCAKGIFRVSKENLDKLDHHQTDRLTCIAYGKADGMESIQCNCVAKPASWKSRDGRLWFATTKGLIVTDPELNRESNEKPPTVLIEEVIADKQPLALPSKNCSPGEVASADLTIPAGRGELEFHYTALSLQAPEKDHFKYKLEGVDPDWSEVTRRVVNYNHLRPGKYVFHVLACNNDGVWNNTGATVSLMLTPHFWQTWWFASFGVLFLAGSVGTGMRYFTRRNLRAQLQRVEQQRAIEQERIRIARDMHDEIGAKLTKISFLGAVAKRKLLLPEEAGQQIDKMSQTARDVIRALDEIVWAVNPANDSLEDLATYLCRNAAEFFTDSPIVCQFNIPPELPAFRLGTHVRHNVLLAAKEALNNVLKHSGATHVHVQIADSAGTFIVTIRDNGRGFDAESRPSANGNGAPPKAPRVGNGLTNMQQRLEAVRGRCEVQSSAGHGTTVSFTVYLNGKSN